MAASDSEIDPVAVPAHVLSMTDEEGDIQAFHSYLRTMPADSLWDIVAHIDGDRYPLRVQAAQREIARRRLFFISPYTRFEGRLRNLFGAAVSFAVLAAALRAIGSLDIPLDPGEHLCWFFDIAIGGPPAARMLLPLVCLVAAAGAVLSVMGSLISAWYLLRHKLRHDVFAMGVGASIIACVFLRLATSR